MQKISDKNALLGHWICSAGGNADVYQTKKNGRHFYTRCECCGLQQGTGAKRQQDIYDNAVFFDKAAVIRPSNVALDLKPEVNPVEPAKVEATPAKTDIAKDFDPSEPPEKVESSEPGMWKKVTPLAIFGIAAAVGIWLN